MKKLQLTAFLTLLVSMSVFSQGTVSTVVDSSAFRFTDDLIFDSSGNLYCADYSGDAVYKMTPSGGLSIFADGMNTPNGIAFDSAENLFVCDNIGNAIYKINSSGVFVDTFQITAPSGIIKDASSDTMIYTTYGAESTIRKLAPNGTVTDFHVGSPLDGPVGLAYCQNELYVANFSNREIYRVEPDTLIFITQLPGTGSLGFLAVVGDYLMATAFNTHKIYTVDPIAQTADLYSGGSAGHVNGPVTGARFNTPNGIVANATNDTIYISEYNSRRLRMITDFTASNPENSIEMNVEIFPNPTNQFLNVEVANNAHNYSVQILDLKGRVMATYVNLLDSNLSIDISQFEAGSYLLKIESENSLVKSEQIIKIN